MRPPLRLSVFPFLLCLAPAAAADDTRPGAPVAAVVETTLRTDGEHIRQLAFDGDPATYFLSATNPGRDDHFTLVFDRPVSVASLAVTTGRPDGRDRLGAAALEVSAEGTTFEQAATFRDGEARARPDGRKLRAVRVRPTEGQRHPLALREIVIASDPPVGVFKYPVEFIIDVRDAPRMKGWADRAARVCERQYAMVNEELKSEGYRPPRRVWMTMKKDHRRNVAEVSGDRITGSVQWFSDHPDDVGAMVHETVHVVQGYRAANNPSWLVEGVCDYIRFFKYEPGKLGPIDPQRAHYDGSYRVTAAFLAHLSDRYDRHIVRKLNRVMREGKYRPEVFRDLTGKTLKELDDEWRATLMGK